MDPLEMQNLLEFSDTVREMVIAILWVHYKIPYPSSKQGFSIGQIKGRGVCWEVCHGYL